MTYEVTEEGVFVDGVRVYVAFDRGNLWAMIRAPDKATFDDQALAVGLKIYQNQAQDAMTDPDTGEVLKPAVDASGPLITAPGATITEIGPHVITPGKYDNEGNELSPPILDTRHHVNFWLNSRLVGIGAWEKWALAWSQNGSSVTPNKSEQALELQGIELIDPATVYSPSNRLL